MTVATGQPGGWRVAAPAPTGDVATLLVRLAGEGGPVALGVDFPLGLPRAYAALHAVEPGFPDFLRTLAGRPSFFQVCATIGEITPQRPFYPMRGVAGMTRLAHAQALGLPDSGALSRVCDRATGKRPAGAPLFWTLGANQSGKAAIAAWRDLLLPALAAGFPLALWPFDGPLLSLLKPSRVVVAETYPAESMAQLGVRMSGSKRRQIDRARLAAQLRSAMATLAATPEPALSAAMDAGFGMDAAGEDRFDSVVGLLGVLAVLSGHCSDAAPADPWILTWEGWVLGQAAPLGDLLIPGAAIPLDQRDR